MKTITTCLFAALTLVLNVPAFGGTTIISDTFDVSSDGTTGFALDNGVNRGINPPATRLTGTAASGIHYLQTVLTKPEAVYDISDNALRIQTNSGIGRFTLSADGVTPFDFATALGTSNATPANPIVYDIRISMRNDATTAARFSFGVSTTEGDINAMDCAVQVYRNAAGNNFYTLAQRVDTGSSGVPDFGLTTLTAAAPANTVTTFLPILIRITDAGEESDTNYNSRAQISINNGASWIFDTQTDTTVLTNGWRFDGAARYFLFDIAGNASGSVFYDEFSVTLQPTWNGGGIDDNWSTSENWSGGSPASGDSLFFAGTTRLTPNMEEDYSVGTVNFHSTAGAFTIGASEGKTLTLAGDIVQNSASAQTLNVPISLSSISTIQTIAGNLTLNGVISGSGGLTKSSVQNNLTLNGLNTYSGATTVNRGNLFFNSIGNVNEGPTALGAPTGSGVISIGQGNGAVSLRYTGSGHTTDRVINLAGTTGTASIYASGTGPIVFTSAFTATGNGAKTLVLRGANTADNMIVGAIVNSTGNTALTKNDAGKWILAGANTYSGATTVTAGSLFVNGSISSTSAVTVAAAGTLGGTGTVPGTVVVNGSLSAGDAIGTLTTGPLTLNNNGTNVFQLNSAVGVAGLNWDLVNAEANNVDVQAVNATPFKFRLVSMGVTDFNKDTTYSWPAITGSVQNFAADKFAVNDIGFTNDLAGGTFSIGSDGSALSVQFQNNQGPSAAATNFTFAANVPFEISIADLLADRTSDPDGDARSLVTLISTNASVSTNATHIIINSPTSSTESIAYVVQDVRNYRAGDTVRMATNSINVVITSSPGGGVLTIKNEGGNAQINFQGNPGEEYIIQRSQNLTNWSDIATNTAALDGSIQFSETPPHNPAFYRTRTE